MTSQEYSRFYYTGLRLEQRPGAPRMYLITVEAGELLQWADVPNAKADYMAGYQRTYSPERAKDITDFLTRDKNNIIPGAVIVTVASDAVDISSGPAEGIENIAISVSKIEFEGRLQRVYSEFSERLSNQERESIPGVTLDPAAIASEEEADSDSGIPESYLALLTAELKDAINDISSIPKDRQEAIRYYIDSVSKPALIIDGQHRVFGAKDVSQYDIRLPVVLLPGMSVAEQVFHFYVLNNKAKPLTPTELRRTISTSLTNAEIDELWERFENAGVNPEATRWTHRMDTDPRSPFRGLIDFGLNAGGFIKENVAYQLVSKFVKMPRKYRILHRDIEAWETGNDERLVYFYTFWSAIRDRYQDGWDAGVEAGGNQLFYKAAMLVLQELILDFLVQVMNVRRAEGKGSPFTDLDELQRYVKASIQDLPLEFFTIEWQEKQLDTSERRAFLHGQMDTAIRNQGKFLGNQQLFKKS